MRQRRNLKQRKPLFCRGASGDGAMRRAPEPNLSINEVDKSEAESLRALLEHTEPADLFDKCTGERLGRVIARAATALRSKQN
jgi:hypothetical protein